MLWVPVEKLFMSEIGFDAATVGLMAAVYAALVPLIEIPSGILADRWSRRGVLIIAATSLAAMSLIGGLSHSPATYFLSALALATYFAMYSGTLEAVVYDTVLEETGTGEGFERRIGRVRASESSFLVAGALAGGFLAELTSPRATYYMTIPFAIASIAALVCFREPQLHRTQEPLPLRDHVATTVSTVLGTRRLVPVVVLAVLAALLVSSIFEFGPLWLVDAEAPPGLYGPYWALLTATLGLGALVAGRLRLERPITLVPVAVLMTVGCLALVQGNLALVVAGQAVTALLVVVVSIRASQLLHDSVRSNIRTGVASGVSALGWIIFLPSAALLGVAGRDHGMHVAGWLLFGVVLLLVGALGVVAWTRPDRLPTSDELAGRVLRDVRRCLVVSRHLVEPLDCDHVVELVTDFLEHDLDPHVEVRLVNHLARCEGCARYVRQMRRTVELLRGQVDGHPLPATARASLLAGFRESLGAVTVERRRSQEPSRTATTLPPT
jgi:MFS family permease